MPLGKIVFRGIVALGENAIRGVIFRGIGL
jgi:hypothetical protein